MALRDDLLRLCDAYQRLTGVSESGLSNRLFGAGNRLQAIRSGGDLATSVWERAVHWFTENWPKEHKADWPKGVRRVYRPISIPATREVEGEE